jgi:hypothetical protein
MVEVGEKVSLSLIDGGVGSFTIGTDVNCAGCILRPIEKNGGVASGCLAFSAVQNKLRFLFLENGRVILAAQQGDPTNCGVITEMRKRGWLEQLPVSVSVEEKKPAKEGVSGVMSEAAENLFRRVRGRH